MKVSKPNWASHQRRWFGKWHLYLGIIAGAIVAFTGVTGSILVFQDEIDRALNRELFETMEQQHRLEIGEIIPLIKAKHPGLHFDYIMGDQENKPNRAYRLFDFKTEEEFFINPYTAELSGKRIHESSFIHVVTELHRRLLVPVAGQYIVGLATLCLLILTISGLRLWIPVKWAQLKSVLTVRFSAGFKRQNYDWHNVLGFYSSPVVAVLALTGITFTFSPLVIALIFMLNGMPPQGVGQLLSPKSAYTAGAEPLSAGGIIYAAGQAMPGIWVVGVAFPADSTGSYRLDVLGLGLPKGGKREMVILDQYTGKVLLNSRKDFPTAGRAYLAWLQPLHFGTFGGWPTRILALLGGLMPLLLFITGFIIWWPRYRKQNGKGKWDDVPVRGALSASGGWQFFVQHILAGFRYAGWVLLLSGVMGALYGLFSGIIWQPAVFTVAFTAFFVILNFLVALPVFGIHLLKFLVVRRGGRGPVRYFALSLAFLLGFIAAYLLLMETGLLQF